MKKYSNLFREYTFHAKGIWIYFMILLLLSVMIAGFSVLNAASLKLLLDIASGESSFSVFRGALSALFVIVFGALLNALKSIVSVETQNKIAGTAKSRLLEHIEKVPLLKISSYHTGDLLTRISDDTDICAKMLPDIGISIAVGALSCIAALIYAFWLNWKLAVLCICLSPLAVLWSRLVLPFLQKYAALTREKESNIRSFSQEEISYLRVIKSFSSYQQSQKQFCKRFQELSRARFLTAAANAILNGGATVIGFLSFIGAASLGAYLALKGEITVGTIVGFIQLLNFIVWPFTELMPLLGEFQNGKAAMVRIRELERISCEEQNEVGLNTEHVVLYVQNAAFTYGKETIMEHVNLELESRQFVGIMGPSGCGKSTLIQMLMALYQPTEGHIYLSDGEQCAEGVALRKYISYVPQDHQLISGTVAENIAYGKEQYHLDEVIAAAKQAGIHDDIMALPEQYSTLVQEHGANFSFGQAQRIAIARAIYKNAPVLILDEPTASLDSESKKRMIHTLRKEAKQRLCIMVCHDQTENEGIFDRVLQFEHGTVRCSGFKRRAE